MPVGSSDDRAEMVGPQHLRSVRRQRAHNRRRWKVVCVPHADRHQCDAWIHRVDERGAAARLAPVMTNLENIGTKRGGVMRQEPFLFGSLGIPHEQHAHLANANRRHDAGKIGIGE